MAKNPHVHPDFVKITAVRISKSAGMNLSLKVADGYLAKGALYQNNVPLLDAAGNPERNLTPREVKPTQMVTLRVHADQQAQVGIVWPMWENPCFAPTLISLGNYFPLDPSIDTGMGLPAGVTPRLPWTNPPGGLLPPEKDLEVQIHGTGLLTWSSRGLTSTYTLQAAPGVANELYVALLMRNGETGHIMVPACKDTERETELRL